MDASVRSVEFHPKAQAELISAARFFEGKSVNLGLTFIRTVQRTTQRIPAFSNRGRRFGRHLRRLLVPGFPYGLLYRAPSALPRRRRGSRARLPRGRPPRAMRCRRRRRRVRPPRTRRHSM
ncbi:MAG: hypothetical protein E6J56_02675 [Deltaproteobacteria bacterium]|nr:MAG: hypothetical protein E6J77_17385 [Deltaproteobacteria bacterium]TMB58511.1 MAG: hypothetical protein E6J56_02675 [Deltaproteobacteria bacterium]